LGDKKEAGARQKDGTKTEAANTGILRGVNHAPGLLRKKVSEQAARRKRNWVTRKGKGMNGKG